MAKVYYPAVIERGADGGFWARFPDLDGCVSAGDTQAETLRMAEEALALHLEGMATEGEAIPEASEIGSFELDAESEAAALAMVGVEEPKLGERVNVWLPRSLISQLDSAADEAGKSRSAFVAQAIRERLAGRPNLTVVEKIEALVRRRPGLSKREIAEELFGVPVQQRVNADVNWLADQNRIESDQGWPARFRPVGGASRDASPRKARHRA